jgi:hypothetical protein
MLSMSVRLPAMLQWMPHLQPAPFEKIAQVIRMEIIVCRLHVCLEFLPVIDDFTDNKRNHGMIGVYETKTRHCFVSKMQNRTFHNAAKP